MIMKYNRGYNITGSSSDDQECILPTSYCNVRAKHETIQSLDKSNGPEIKPCTPPEQFQCHVLKVMELYIMIGRGILQKDTTNTIGTSIYNIILSGKKPN